MTIEQNPHVLTGSAFDDGYNKSKQDILNIIDRYQCGPYPDKTQDILFTIRKEIEGL